MLGARLAPYGIIGEGQLGDPWARDPEACRKVLEDAGFADVSVRMEQHGFYFATAEDYWNEDVLGSVVSASFARLQPHELAQVKAGHVAEVAATATPQGIWREAAVNFTLGRKSA